MSLVHWSAFDDAGWACGGKWPPAVSTHPLVLGPDYPRVSFNPREVTCEGCLAYCRAPFEPDHLEVDDGRH